MYNQRQKKRNAEYRKKHHEGRARERQKDVAKKGGGERQPGKVEHTQEPRAPEPVPQATPSRDVPSNEVVGIHMSIVLLHCRYITSESLVTSN